MTSVKSIDKFYAPNGDIVEDKHYVIDFSDSNKWNSRMGEEGTYNKDKELISFILTKTGLPLVSAEFDN